MTDLDRFFTGQYGLIKICGLREPEHAVAAAAAGADLIGFIFATARRQVSAERARACIAASRASCPDGTHLAVGVFVNAAVDDINATVEMAGLDLVQLHGDEHPEMLDELSVPAIKVFRPRPGEDPGAIGEMMDAFLVSRRPPVALAIDGFSERGAGGEGISADWTAAAMLAEGRPLLLAGGLFPENVGAAIQQVRPLGVDVSSGVECDGEKDSHRIAEFIVAARSAFMDVSPSRRS